MLTSIPRLTNDPSYRCDVPLMDLADYISKLVSQGLDLDPEFQRGHVWNQEQRVRWVEYLLKSGRVHPNHPILLNHTNWLVGEREDGDFVLVDGKQRLTATLDFLSGKFSIFHGFDGNPNGWLASDIPIREMRTCHLTIAINTLETRKDVLSWYLELNEGAVAHSTSEIERVRKLRNAL